jgi:hypothetical protein
MLIIFQTSNCKKKKSIILGHSELIVKQILKYQIYKTDLTENVIILQIVDMYVLLISLFMFWKMKLISAHFCNEKCSNFYFSHGISFLHPAENLEKEMKNGMEYEI